MVNRLFWRSFDPREFCHHTPIMVGHSLDDHSVLCNIKAGHNIARPVYPVGELCGDSKRCVSSIKLSLVLFSKEGEKMLKMFEFIGSSPDGYTEAVKNAVEECIRSGNVVHFFEVIEQRGAVRQGKIKEYQVKVKIAVE